MALPNVPLTRIEQYLAKIAGQDVAIPNVPLTRIEQYLAAIAENGGGGNPNTTQTIQGTLANPWGDVSYSELAAALGSGNATATLRFEFNGTTAILPLMSYSGVGLIYGSSADVQPTLSDSVAAEFVWNSGGDISSARAIMGGQVADMTAYAPGISSYLEIYWHPMP